MTVILRPLISERSMSLTKNSFYTFEVAKWATKAIIEKAVKDKFKVDILDIKIINIPSKKKLQRGRRGYFRVPSFKKAIVKLKKDQKIPLFEQVSEDEAKVTTAETEPEVKEKKSLLRGTKVRIEKKTLEDKQSFLADKEKQEKQTDPKRPTKRSQKEKKK